MDKWQYLVLSEEAAALQGLLNKLGQEGWEAVGLSHGHAKYIVVVLKRKGTS